MFRIVFMALTGGEREIVVPADSERDAVLKAATLRSFGLVVTCTKLDTIEDLAAQHSRLRLRQQTA